MKQFEKIRIKPPKKAAFNLSHERKYTMNPGELVPNLVMEVLPGDTISCGVEALVRFQALLAPIMHRINVTQHFFFVPNRIIWDEWEEFITGGKTGASINHPKVTVLDNSFNPSNPQFNLTIGSLADYLGIPVGNLDAYASDPCPPFSQLPFRAYQQIWNDYYRNESLQDEINFPKNSIDYASTTDEWKIGLSVLRKSNWEKDYFTSMLPQAQRGNPVSIPLLGNAPLKGTLSLTTHSNGTGPSIDGSGALKVLSSGQIASDPGNVGYHIRQDGLAVADLSQASTATISDLRTAFALQRWQEKMMRGGFRYIEQMLVMFGVVSSDARLQRAEYLGGGKLPVTISEVLQTSESNTTPQGNMAGHAYSAGSPSYFKRTFEEHGYIIGIIRVTPRTAYQQGLPRHFTKFDRFQYFWPDFAHIGEQPVFGKELFYDADPTENDVAIGYQPRYSEYRYMPDTVHGNLKKDLNFWHWGRIFNSRPVLNESFVQCNPDTRIYPVIDEDLNGIFKQLIVQNYFNITAIRPVPKYGDPL